MASEANQGTIIVGSTKDMCEIVAGLTTEGVLFDVKRFSDDEWIIYIKGV